MQSLSQEAQSLEDANGMSARKIPNSKDNLEHITNPHSLAVGVLVTKPLTLGRISLTGDKFICTTNPYTFNFYV